MDSANPTTTAAQAAAPDAEEHVQGDLRRKPEVKTHRFTTFILRRWWLMMILVLLFVIFMTAMWTSVVTKRGGNSNGQFLALSHITARRWLVAMLADQRQDKTPVETRSEDLPEFRMHVLYSDSSAPRREGNIFSKANLRKIFETEQQLMGKTGADVGGTFQYPRAGPPITGFNDIVKLDYNYSTTPPTGTPRKPLSIIYDVIFRDEVLAGQTITLADLDGLTDQFIRDRLAKYSSAQYLQQGLGFFFPNDFRGNTSANPNYRGWITRSIIYFGAPVEGFSYYTRDNEKDQQYLHLQGVKQYTDWFAEPDPPGITINYKENILSNDEVSKMVDGDFLLAGSAAIAVFVFITINTQSWFLAAMGMLNIIMAYPCAMATYHGVVGLEINTTMNMLSLFIVLGIGADDIFVYVDAWLQSQHEGEEIYLNEPARIYWVWARASSAMMVTTLTTFFAFVMTAASPIPTIATFGIIAALLIFFNYLFIITWFPACVIMWEKLGLARRGLCFTPWCVPTKPIEVVEDDTADKDDVESGNNDDNNGKAAATIPRSRTANLAPMESQSSRFNAEVDIDKFRPTERIFYTRIAPFVLKFKYPLLIFFTLLFVVMAVFAVQFQPPDVSGSFLPPTAEIVRANDLSSGEFPASAKAVESPPVFFFWGVNPDDPLDNSGVEANEDVNVGRIVLSKPSEFYLSKSNVEWLNQTCHDMQAATTSDGTSQLVAANGAKCWTDDFIPWNNAYDANPNNTALDWSSQSAIAKRIQLFLADPRYTVEHQRAFGGLLNVANPERVEYVRFEFDTRVKRTDSNSRVKFWYSEWTLAMKNVNKRAPDGLKYGMQASRKWAQVVTKDELASATWQSIFISFAVAVVVLMATTKNFPVATLASLSLLGVTVTIIGTLVIMGFTLDLVESICGTILVGLAVDFSVHLSHSFNETHTRGTFVRVRGALVEMGVSVLSGAITTLMAAFFLFFAVLTFFNTFGTFIFVTILCSLLWSVFFLMPALIVFGPAHKPKGDFSYLWAKYVKKEAVGDDSSYKRPPEKRLEAHTSPEEED